MSTTKQLKVYKGLPNIIKSRARGYWDSIVVDSFETDGTTKNITMDAYDGLFYSTSLSPNDILMIDLSGTILPYKWDYNDKLVNSKYCFKPAGQNYDVEYYTYNTFTVIGTPTINYETGVISGCTGRNHIRIVTSKKFATGSINSFEIAAKVHTPTTWTNNGRIYNSTSSADGFVMEITQSRPLVAIGSVIIDVAPASLTSDKDYWFKATYDGTTAKGYYSEDGINYTEYSSNAASSSDMSIADVVLDMGQRSYNNYANANICAWSGAIDLNDCYLKVNDEIIWSGLSTTTYNNYTITGTLTVNEASGIVSSFGSTNYINLPKSFDPGNNTWEMVFKVTYSTSGISYQRLCGARNNTSLSQIVIGAGSETNHKLITWISSNNTSWNIASGVKGNTVLQNNQTYWIRAKFTGTNYIISLSTDSITYNEEINISSTLTIKNNDSVFLIGNAELSGYWSGSIDLSECYIKINDEIWWKAGGANINSFAGCTVDYTDDGSAVTLNCFALGDTSVVLTETNTYEGGTYLGMVNIPSHINFGTQSGDTIVTSSGTPLDLNGISELSSAPSVTDTQLTFADDGNSTVSFSMQQLKDYVSPAPSATTLHQYDRVDGKATVAGFWTDGNGQRYAVCVVDAAYRSGGQRWSSSSDSTPLPNYTSSSAVLAAGESGTWNTDTILNNYNPTNYPAFNVARNACTVTVDNQTFVSCLPNATEVQIIYNDKATLDTYDTTLSRYPNNSLSSWNIGGNSSSNCWSSVEYDSDRSWHSNSFGTWLASYKDNNYYGIIPIIEIPVDENGTVITN